MSRRILTSNVGTLRLEAEGMSQPPTPKPDANSSAELIAAHHDKPGYGTLPVQATIRWDRIAEIHQQNCEACDQGRTCPYQRWLMTGKLGYQPVRDWRRPFSPIRRARAGDPPNYPSFTTFGKYGVIEWDKLVATGAVTEITSDDVMQSPVEPCRLGIVLKGRDIFEAHQAGIQLVDETSVTAWDQQRANRGLEPIKKRLICDASVNGYNGSLARVPFVATSRSALEKIMFPGCWMASTDLSSFYTLLF